MADRLLVNLLARSRRLAPFAGCLAFLQTPAIPARAEVTVIVARNSDVSATPEFQFEKVSAPRRSAALAAHFTLIDGKPDPNGATLDALHDGKFPDYDDQPRQSFFFAQGSDGGRILVDLGKQVPIAEVDTYSWHRAGRGPQVYKLYASTGSEPGFVLQPKRPQYPMEDGWKLIANVDTRPPTGSLGGQYGVAIRETTDAPVATCRYLLFDVSAAYSGDAFGNTFYSEIVVLEKGVEAKPGELLVPVPRGAETAVFNEQGYKLVFKNDVPGFAPELKEGIVRTFFATYPKLVSDWNSAAAREVCISVESRAHGVAATIGATIHVNPRWLQAHPRDFDLITHEAMHVVQHYPKGVPSWLVEGIADYARYRYGIDNAGAGWSLPEYTSRQAYTDSYQVTARFLAWLEKHVQAGTVAKLDQIARAGHYTPAAWQEITGRSADELWAEYSKRPEL